MINCHRLCLLGLGLLAVGPVNAEEPLPWPDDTAPAESVLKKTTLIIREKTGATPDRSLVSGDQVGKSGEPDLAAADRPEDRLQLDPVIVYGQQVPAIPPALHEAPVEKFFRTGTIWQKIGCKFTTKFWACGDKGLMLSFSW